MIPFVAIIKVTDSCGRLTIPLDLRLKMKMGEGDYFEFYVDDGKIVLKKYFPGCFFCDNTEELRELAK